MTAPNPLFLRDEELDRGLDLLYLADRQVTAEVRGLLAEVGLDQTDHRVLFCVERRPGATLAELCEVMGVPKQTLSRHLRGLASRGLLGPAGDAPDRRRRPLKVTAAAAEVLARVNAAQKRRLRQAFKSAGAAAVEGFQRVLQELVTEPRRGSPPARRGIHAGAGAR